jgi:hypothetical protein
MRNAELQLRLEAQRSDLEDADFAQLASQMQRHQLGLEAALQVTSRILQTSILNYLQW